MKSSSIVTSLVYVDTSIYNAINMLIFYFLGCKLLAMESSTVPLRHTDLQGNVKLPRRFAVPGSCETSTDRLEDLARAMTWVRQELVRVYG